MFVFETKQIEIMSSANVPDYIPHFVYSLQAFLRSVMSSGIDGFKFEPVIQTHV